LWYAATYYPVPLDIKKDLQREFENFVNFPRVANPSVSEAKMKKLCLDGGIKLIDIEAKVEIFRRMWLMDLVQNVDLSSHLALVTLLVGIQRGGREAPDILFTNTHYVNRVLNVTHSEFYKEGFKAAAKLSLSKKIEDLNSEKVFYNPMFTDKHFKTTFITNRCEKERIYTYGPIIDDTEKFAK